MQEPYRPDQCHQEHHQIALEIVRVGLLPGIHSAPILLMLLSVVCVSKALILVSVSVLVVAHCMRMGTSYHIALHDDPDDILLA